MLLKTIVATLALGGLVMATGIGAPTAPQLPPQPKVRPAGIPAKAMLLSPCVAGMGEHWGIPQQLPMGPIYGVWNGKPVFTEIMLTTAQLEHGISYDDLRALPGYHIDHVNVEYEPHGHEGLPVPHYDIHAYYVSVAVEKSICPHGIPDPAMKPGM